MSDKPVRIDPATPTGSSPNSVGFRNPRSSVQRKLMDLFYVEDTTRSMDNEIDAITKTNVDFVEESRNSELDTFHGVIAFGDTHEPGSSDTIEVVCPLTNDISKVQRALKTIPRNSGYGNGGENCLEAISLALEQRFRPGSVKVMILITDEPAHQHRISAHSIIQRLVAEEVMVWVISIDLPYYREMAEKTGGEWIDIGVFDQSTGKRANKAQTTAIFRRVAKKAAETVRAVYLEAGGDVKQYLQLKSGKK